MNRRFFFLFAGFKKWWDENNYLYWYLCFKYLNRIIKDCGERLVSIKMKVNLLVFLSYFHNVELLWGFPWEDSFDGWQFLGRQFSSVFELIFLFEIIEFELLIISLVIHWRYEMKVTSETLLPHIIRITYIVSQGTQLKIWSCLTTSLGFERNTLPHVYWCLINKTANVIDNTNFFPGVFLDLSEVFDTIDHSIL